jgi:hypothetical protein
MKQITIDTFEITELSEKAKEKAYYKWLEGREYFWGDDNKASLEKFAEIFPVKIRNWSYGDRGAGVDYSFTERDEIEELSGWRLATYLWNNYRDTIYQRKYLQSFRRDNRIFHPMVRQKVEKDRETGKEYYWTKVTSNWRVDTYNCPLTGYFIDNSLLDPIWKFMDNPDNRSFKDLLDDCFGEWVKDCEEDYEFSTSMERFVEEAHEMEWMYDEKGRMVEY